MDRCPNCGATVRAGAKFCTTCGMRLPEAAAPVPAAEETPRSPFDSTSTVASRWPSRTSYESADASPTETATDAAGASVETTPSAVGAEAEASAEESTASETGSTWGAWTAPAPATAEPESEPSAEAEPAAETTTWGESTASEPEQAADQAQAPESPESEAVEPSWGRTGETDFLQLPEQPDPAAWRSIESELASGPGDEEDGIAAEGEAGDAVDTMIDEAVVDEESGDVTEAVAVISYPSVDRANELLDELRAIIVQLPGQAETGQTASEAPTALSIARASDEEVARFAELRAALEAAQSQPRDIGTMLDISGRLDVIVELHDAFLRLNDAASGSSAESEGDEPGED